MRSMRWVFLVAAIGSGASGCIAGQIYNADRNGEPLPGVTIYSAQACPTCPVYRANTPADNRFPGSFSFDPYVGQPNVAPKNGVEATKFVFSTPGFQTVTVYHRPVYSPWTLDGVTKDASLFAVYMGSTDSDGDGLADSHENMIGTNRFDTDTDDDGLLDGWEVYGHNWVDYKYYGANPRHRDVFVEIDYERYRDGNGVIQSAELTTPIVEKLTQHFAGLAIPNPDGVNGIALHLLQDQRLPANVECEVNDATWGSYYVWTTENFNQYRRPGFRYACSMLINTAHPGGRASGQRFYITSRLLNQDPSDDQVEQNHFYRYAVFIHELSHTLGLGHGGDSDVNCKPNYPSYMNYAYDYSFNGSPLTLGGTQIQLSRGRFRDSPLNETSLNERNSFPGHSAGELSFLVNFPRNGTWVDWNRNGTFDTVNVSANIQIPHDQPVPAEGQGQCGGFGAGGTLTDHDDLAAIASRMAGVLSEGPRDAGSPASAGSSTASRIAAPPAPVSCFRAPN